jgi:hypothetical protein
MSKAIHSDSYNKNIMKTEIRLLSFTFVLLLSVSCNKEEIINPAARAASVNTENTVETTVAGPSLLTEETIRTDIRSINKQKLQGTWTQTGAFDSDNNPLTEPSFFVHMNPTVHFTEEEVRIDWLDPTGFSMLDYTPEEAHECYHAMYRLSEEGGTIDIAALYCSMPLPPAGRCGPPQFQRFRIVSLNRSELRFESISSSWVLDGLNDSLNNIPDDYKISFVYERG